jgi:hypothetical protein
MSGSTKTAQSVKELVLKLNFGTLVENKATMRLCPSVFILASVAKTLQYKYGYKGYEESRFIFVTGAIFDILLKIGVTHWCYLKPVKSTFPYNAEFICTSLATLK